MKSVALSTLRRTANTARRFLPICALVSVLSISTAFADVLVGPADYTGSRSSNNNAQITSCCAWDLANGFQISWNITEPVNPGGLWHYSYSFTTAQGDVSHWIMEVSPSFTTANISNISGASIDGGVVTTYGSHPSNPGIAGNIFGIKWNGNKGAVSFNSDRAPIRGDFYAKDGNAGGLGENYAYNTSFGTDPTAATTSFAGWIPTPDTTTTGQVPEPSSVVLLASTVLGVASLLRKRLSA
jgi:hypothetical protein